MEAGGSGVASLPAKKVHLTLKALAVSQARGAPGSTPPARLAGTCPRAIQALAGPAHAVRAAEPQAQPDDGRSAAAERKRDARGVPKSGGGAAKGGCFPVSRLQIVRACVASCSIHAHTLPQVADAVVKCMLVVEV